MLRAYPGGGAPGYGTGLQEACSCNGTQKAPVRHPLGADPDGLAAADQRHRLSWWAARDPDRKQSRAYSAWELLQALAQLSPPLQPLGAAAARPAPAAAPPPPPPAPPPRPVDPLAEPLGAIWGRALQALQLPSTRMLFCQQARLEALHPTHRGELVAVVAVAPYWLPMVQTRAALLSDALGRALDGRPVWLVLEAAQ